MVGEGSKELSLPRYCNEVKSRIVARGEEIKNILATLDAGRHLILEGAPGTTKTTILRTITEVCQIPFSLVEDNLIFLVRQASQSRRRASSSWTTASP